MKSIAYIGLFCLLVSLSHLVSAQGEGSRFAADELKSIRNISQSILQVRGQERRKIFNETQSLRQDIEDVRSALKQIVELDSPSLVVLHKNNHVTASEPLVIPNPPIWARLNRSLISSIGENKTSKKPMEKKKSGQDTVHVEVAKQIIVKRKALIEDELPAFWQLGKRGDEKKLRLKQALESLEADVDALSAGAGQRRREKIQALLTKLDGKPEPSGKALPENPSPTITSITKHYRK